MSKLNPLDIVKSQVEQIKDLLVGERLDKTKLVKENRELKRKLNIYRHGSCETCRRVKTSDLTYVNIIGSDRKQPAYNTIEYGGDAHDSGVLIDLDKDNNILGVEFIKPVEIRTSKLMIPKE